MGFEEFVWVETAAAVAFGGGADADDVAVEDFFAQGVAVSAFAVGNWQQIDEHVETKSVAAATGGGVAPMG